MKVLFVYRGSENLGIEYLSSALRAAGHETRLFFDPAVFAGDQLHNNALLARLCSLDHRLVPVIKEYQPGLVAFSVYTGNYAWCLRMAEMVRQHVRTPIVFGGVHITAVPEEALRHRCVDYAICGEGEAALVELASKLQRGQDSEEELRDIQNLVFRSGGKARVNSPRPYEQNLDAIPFPDKDLFYDKVPMLANNYLIVTSRGCPYDCTYCSNSMYHQLYQCETRHVRRRTPGNVLDELRLAKARYRIRLIKFADDIFTSSVPWLQEFLPAYRRQIGIPFFCSVHPRTIRAQVAALLKESGCWFVTMGVQSGSERVRTEIFHRKGSNRHILEAAATLKHSGLRLSLDTIFGAPSETSDDLLETWNLVSQIKPDRILTFSLTYYPGTPIVQYAREHGLLSDDDIQKMQRGEIGYTHSTGSIEKDRIPLYMRFQLLFQLRSLVQNDRLFSLLSRCVPAVPFKASISKLVLLLNGVRIKDVMLMDLIRFAFAKKRVP
jgi:radical SAM superfamily enzyme YgiQ (UPF0313 family)